MRVCMKSAPPQAITIHAFKKKVAVDYSRDTLYQVDRCTLLAWRLFQFHCLSESPFHCRESLLTAISVPSRIFMYARRSMYVIYLHEIARLVCCISGPDSRIYLSSYLAALVIFTNNLIVGKKISRVKPSDSVGKNVGKNIPRLRLRNSVGNLSFVE